MEEHCVGGVERWWMVNWQPWGNSFAKRSLSKDGVSTTILHKLNAELRKGNKH